MYNLFMGAETQLQKQSAPPPITPEEIASRNRFTEFNINLVVIVLTVVAFLPSFLDRDFYDPIGRFILMIVLGSGYGLMATLGTMWHERHQTWWSGTLYFTIQIGIVMSLLLMSGNISENFWMLMLPLSGQGFSFGRWRGAIAISIIQLLLYGAVILFLNRGGLDADLFRNIFFVMISIGSAMFFVMLFTFIAVREGETRQEVSILASDLREANRRLAEYAAQAEELATTRERNRLAREIHDNLGHYLTVVNVQIEAARTIMAQDPERAEDALTKAQRLTQEGLQSVRQSVSTLRESPLDDRLLSEAIALLLKEIKTAGVDVSLTVTGEERPLPPKYSLTLYRAVQEGLTNIRKYAKATAVFISLEYATPHQILLSINDNGIGSADPTGGFGLLGLRERVQLLDGSLDISTQPDEGFTISISLPLPRQLEEDTR